MNPSGTQTSGRIVRNVGSTARDFLMLERNFLAHVKLALLLTLISCSLILRARLVPDDSESDSETSAHRIPLASVQIFAALATLAAGAWEYHSGYSDLRGMRAFFEHVNPHLAIMSVVVATVFGTSVLLLVAAE